MELEGGRFESIPLWIILNETVVKQSRDKNPSPLLAGRIMRSILTGQVYPDDLYMAMIRRIRSEQDDRDKKVYSINHTRVAVIKACLARKARIYKNEVLKEVLTVSLNENSINTGYRLGRLFSLLEKAQETANPGINATIKDRYFLTASASPGSVFPVLMRLSQHHLNKLNSKWLEIEIGKVVEEINNFPAHLNMDEQGLFILGYYHQRQSFFKKKGDVKEVVAE